MRKRERKQKVGWGLEAPEEMGMSGQQIQCKNNLLLAREKQKAFLWVIMNFDLLKNL